MIQEIIRMKNVYFNQSSTKYIKKISYQYYLKYFEPVSGWGWGLKENLRLRFWKKTIHTNRFLAIPDYKVRMTSDYDRMLAKPIWFIYSVWIQDGLYVAL